MPGDVMKVGNVTVTMLKDLPAMRGDPRIMWPNVDPAKFTGYPQWFNERGLADITIAFLQVQVAAGASAVQLFDSWAGSLSADDYRSCVLPHSHRCSAPNAAAERTIEPTLNGWATESSSMARRVPLALQRLARWVPVLPGPL